MQADDFEKKIKNKMKEFGLVPDSAIWKAVSIKLEKEKKKRRIVFYVLFTSILLLTGASAWWFINNETAGKFAKKDITKINNNAANIENYETKQHANSVSGKLKKINNAEIKMDATATPKKLAFTKNVGMQKKVELQKATRNETKNNDFTKAIYPKVITKELIEDLEKTDENIHNKENKFSKSLPPHKFYNPDLAANKKTDTSIIKASVENPNFKRETNTNTTFKKSIQIKNNKKWSVGFTVYGGSSNNRSGVPLLQKDYVQDYSNSSGSVTNSGNYNYNINTTNRFKRSFSFGFGIFSKKQLAKKISLSAGADYHSYTAKLTVGNKVSQQSRFYDSSVEKDISVNEYFSPGDTINYSNKYQFLQLPINLGYQVNKNSKNLF